MSFKTIKDKITGVYNPVKKAVINATADVISAPAQIGAARAKAQGDSDVKTLKTARAYDNAPGMEEDGTVTPAGMARSMAQDVKDRIKPKRPMGMKPGK